MHNLICRCILKIKLYFNNSYLISLNDHKSDLPKVSESSIFDVDYIIYCGHDDDQMVDISETSTQIKQTIIIKCYYYY